MKAHQFTIQILNQKLDRLNTGPVTGLPAQGTGSTPGSTPATTPMGTPAATPRGANHTQAGPSPTQTIIYMMQNVLDDLSVLHPGIQGEVRAAFWSPRMPTAGSTAVGIPNFSCKMISASMISSPVPCAGKPPGPVLEAAPGLDTKPGSFSWRVAKLGFKQQLLVLVLGPCSGQGRSYPHESNQSASSWYISSPESVTKHQ